MNKIKVIKTATDYEEALALLKELLSRDPDPESDEGQQLSLLGTLIKDYELKEIPSDLPDPIEAIKFRMEQSGLKPSDLVHYLGSRSRVSEILSGKRQLSLEMVRALQEGLGIPAKVLIKKPDFTEDSEYRNWDDRLVSEMKSRGYFDEESFQKKLSKTDLLRNFFLPIGSPAQLVALWRKSSYRVLPYTDKQALAAWSTKVIRKAQKIKVSTKYSHGLIDINFMQKLVRLSISENGPTLAKKALLEKGIILIIEKHLSKTKLDGATLLVNKVNPIIGLTLRYDRLDNFWFTLMHEIAHLVLHFDKDTDFYYDELDSIKGRDISSEEKEADDLASEALIPSSKWEISPAKLVPSVLAAQSLAAELGVHVAIVAGKIRYEGEKWIYLNDLVNKAKIRQYFPEESWE